MLKLQTRLSPITAGLLCAALLLSLLAGCSRGFGAKAFRYDIPEPVDNLDPQFATDASSRLVLVNLYEGLVTVDPAGDIHPGVAERYTVSADQLTYTFHLRPDAAWEGGEPVTAKDFVFTFRRLFGDRSPNAYRYAAIEGAEELMAGRTPNLPGVRAPDDHTLVIHLERPDPMFLERLAEPAAAPCHQATYEESRGRYGLELKYVYSNGPFMLNRWDESRIDLRKNEPYRSEKETVAESVYIYIGRDTESQFLDGKTDVAFLSREQQEKLSSDRYDILPIQKTVWCIVFNQDHRIWGNALIRQGLAHSIDRQYLGEQAPFGFRSSSVMIPDAMQVLGKPYREMAFSETPLEFNTQEALRLFELGLDSLGLKQLPNSAGICVPEMAMESLGMGELKQSWQKYLSAYINFEVNTPSQIQNRLRTGEYQMILMPFAPADANAATLLEVFGSGSDQNYVGYYSVLYDEILATAAQQPTPELAAEKYAQAETLLLSDAVVIPLYFETSYLAMAKGMEGLQVSPFGDQIYFKYAQKDS